MDVKVHVASKNDNDELIVGGSISDENGDSIGFVSIKDDTTKPIGFADSRKIDHLINIGNITICTGIGNDDKAIIIKTVVAEQRIDIYHYLQTDQITIFRVTDIKAVPNSNDFAISGLMYHNDKKDVLISVIGILDENLNIKTIIQYDMSDNNLTEYHIDSITVEGDQIYGIGSVRYEGVMVGVAAMTDIGLSTNKTTLIVQSSTNIEVVRGINISISGDRIIGKFITTDHDGNSNAIDIIFDRDLEVVKELDNTGTINVDAHDNTDNVVDNSSDIEFVEDSLHEDLSIN